MRDIVDSFLNKRILVIGDVMVDEYVWGQVRRISPEAPVPVVEVVRRTFLPGGAANTAANVVSLGGQALLGGVTGEDSSAESLASVLGRYGVSSEGLIIDSSRPTTTKTRIMAHHQQVARMDLEQRLALPVQLEELLLSWARRQLPDVDACILADYDKGVISPRLASKVIAAAREMEKPVIVDPKGIDYAKYSGATIVTPNVHEALKAIGREAADEVPIPQLARQIMQIATVDALLITRGAEGMSLFRPDVAALHIPAVARNVFDVTGAGDTVVSTLALALATGASLDDAARLANQAAGIVVGKMGTSTVTREELWHHLD